MRYSAAVLAAAVSTVSAFPLLGNLGDATSTVGDVTGILSSGDDVGSVGNVLKLVYTLVPLEGGGSPIPSLAVLNGAGSSLFGYTCTSQLTTDLFASVPIDFSQVTKEGTGNFLFNGVTYPVEKTIKNAPGVSCVKSITDALSVVLCEVPLVKGVAFKAIADVKSVTNCLADKVPLLKTVNSGLTSLPFANQLNVLENVPGVSTLVDLLSGTGL